MSVEYQTGNLLDFQFGINVIATCCNCLNTMGSGIQKSIRDKWPQVYEADTVAYKSGEIYLGAISYADLGEGRKCVSLYGQYRYGGDGRRYVNYEGFYTALEALKDLLENAHKEGRNYVLGLPYKIASDRAGGEWRIIESMIITLFKDSPIRCVIVRLPDKDPAVAAVADKPADAALPKAA